MSSRFQTKYQATIEDLFSKDFTLGECTLKVVPPKLVSVFTSSALQLLIKVRIWLAGVFATIRYRVVNQLFPTELDLY